MKLKIISSKRTSINSIDDTIKISVPDLSLLKNKNNKEIIEYLFYEDEIIKSFCPSDKIRDYMLYCIFNNKKVEELEKILIEERYTLFSILMNATNHFKNSYNRMKKIDGIIVIECQKEDIESAISLAISLNNKVIILCNELSLKEYSKVLGKYDLKKLKEYDIEVGYQQENTPINIYKLYELSTLVNSLADNIKKYNLSSFETIMYVYDMVKYKIYKKDDNDYLNGRDLDRLLLEEQDAIVCSGYSNLAVAILNSLGIKAKPLISYKERHQRVIVNVNDTKYNRSGVYVFDPTGDRRQNMQDTIYIKKYDYFGIPLQRAKESAYDEISEVLDYSLDDLINILNDKKNIYKSFILHDKLIDIIGFVQDTSTKEDILSVVSILVENYPLIIESYYQKELTIEEFTKMLYSVRRIEYITGMINNIDFDEIRETISDRFTKIECDKFRKRKMSKEMYFLKTLDTKVKMENYLDNNMFNFINGATSETNEIYRDALNLKLIKVLKSGGIKNERK